MAETLFRFGEGIVQWNKDTALSLVSENRGSLQDLRMMKLKQKISGRFRAEAGARQFCRIRGYLASLRKQGLNVLDALLDVFAGHPQSPLPETK
jgi:hypothetical protein